MAAGALAPQLMQSLIAPTTVAVKFVAHRVGEIVILVIVLSRIKFGSRCDLRVNRAFKRLVFLQLLLGGLGDLLLFGVVIKDTGAILTALISKLAVFDRGIDIDPKHVEQFLIAHLFRVVNHLDGFRVPGAAG